MCRWRVRARLRVGYIIIVIITRLPDRPADTLRIFPAVFPPMLLQQGMIGRQPLWSAPPLVPFFFFWKCLVQLFCTTVGEDYASSCQ